MRVKIGNVRYHNNVARLRNDCSNGNPTMRYLCIVEIHTTVNNIKYRVLYNSACYGDFVTGNNKTYLGLHVQYPMFIPPFLTTSGFFSANLHKVYNIKFPRNPSCEGHADNMRTAGRTDKKKLIRRISRLSKRA
jgi:hypothetical protein